MNDMTRLKQNSPLLRAEWNLIYDHLLEDRRHAMGLPSSHDGVDRTANLFLALGPLAITIPLHDAQTVNPGLVATASVALATTPCRKITIDLQDDGAWNAVLRKWVDTIVIPAKQRRQQDERNVIQMANDACDHWLASLPNGRVEETCQTTPPLS